MSAYLEGLKCPICLEDVNLNVRLSGGEPATYDYPGSGPDVEYDVEEAEFNCACLENIEANAPKAKIHKVTRTKKQPLFAGSDTVMWAAVYEKDARGYLITEEIQPLRQAYFEALEGLAAKCTYHYEPDEPYIYED